MGNEDAAKIAGMNRPPFARFSAMVLVLPSYPAEETATSTIMSIRASDSSA